MNDLHQIELTALKWLRKFHTPATDSLFSYLDFFDRGEFYMMLFPLIWFGFSRLWGIRLFFWLMIGSVCNYYFKVFFGQPRPFQLDPSLAVITVKNFGFPSGAAQASFFLIASLIKEKRSVITWSLGIAYLILICFSRVYLGLHFPSDIAGGLAIGAGIFILFLNYAAKIEKEIAKKKPWQQLFLLTAGTLLIYLPLQTPYLGQFSAAIFGVGSGLILSRIMRLPIAMPSIKKALFALVSMISISYLENGQISNGNWNILLLGFWLSFCLPYLFAIKLARKFIPS